MQALSLKLLFQRFIQHTSSYIQTSFLKSNTELKQKPRKFLTQSEEQEYPKKAVKREAEKSLSPPTMRKISQPVIKEITKHQSDEEERVSNIREFIREVRSQMKK